MSTVVAVPVCGYLAGRVAFGAGAEALAVALCGALATFSVPQSAFYWAGGTVSFGRVGGVIVRGQARACAEGLPRITAVDSDMVGAVQESHSFERDVALDGVRGLALALVLLFHCFAPQPLSLTSSILGAFVSSMFVAIDLFFVLSGFLITGVLIRTRGSRHHFRNFYVRRVLRILPPYYVVLAVVFLSHAFFGQRSASFENDARWLALYLQNWVMVLEGRTMAWAGFDHLWSLAVEEQFYLFWPLALWLTPSRWLAPLWLLCS